MTDGEQYVTVQIDGAFRAMRESEARARGLYPPQGNDLPALVQRVRNLEALTELMWAHQENLIERVADLEGDEDDPAAAAVREVVAAWTIPGPRPDIHRAAQDRLRRDWPRLAQALDHLGRTHP